MKELTIQNKDCNQRVDKYLARILPNAGKSFLYKMMRKKNIVLNNAKIQGNEILKTGDVIKIWFSDETFTMLSGNELEIDISDYQKAYKTLSNIDVIYEDEHIVVLNKPVGILSQKSSNNDISLNEWLIGYLLETKHIESSDLSSFKPSVTNRLDRNTSGLVLCGKSVYGLNLLSRIIKDRSVKKFYHAYVLGKPEDKQLLEAYHTKNNETNEVKIILDEEYNRLTKEEKLKFTNIKTAYKLISSEYNGQIHSNISLIEVELITGKTHQIRAHMAKVGFPLLGDTKYGNPQINKKLNLKHQLLHAYRIEFPDEDSMGCLKGKVIESNNDISFIKEE